MVQAIPNLDTWRTLPSKIQVLLWLTWQSLFVLFVHTLRWHSTCSCLYLDKCIVGLICAVDISILITHCHMDGHVFIQKEWHVFMMTIFHPSCMGILLCFASPWQSLQEAQHDLPTSLTLSLEVWDVLDHEYVETREMSSIYAKQLAQLNTQQGCLLLLNVQQVRCEEIYIYILMLWCNLLLWFMQLVVEYLISQCMGIYHRFTEPSYMRANGWSSFYWVPITHWCHHVPQEHAFGSHGCMCSGITSFYFYLSACSPVEWQRVKGNLVHIFWQESW